MTFSKLLENQKVVRLTLGDITYESTERNAKRLCTEVRSVTNKRGLVKTSDFFENTRTSEDTKGYKIVKPGMFVYNPSRINVGSIAFSTEDESVIVSPMYVVFGLRSEIVDQSFLMLYFESKIGKLQIESRTEVGARFRLPYASMSAIELDIPCIEVQREIVKILDAFTELDAELEAELVARQKQYKYYSDRLLALPEVPRMFVGDLFDFKNGLNKGKEFFGNGTPIVNFVDVFKNRALTETMIKGRVEVTPKEQDLYSAKKNDVFFTRTSEIRDEIGMASVLLADIKHCVFSGFVLRARPKTDLLLPKFCAYIFSSPDVRKEIVRNSSYTTRALTNGGVLSRLEIPIPPLAEQARIVEIIDKLDTFINDISSGLPAEIAARRKQYAFYRDKLLSFKEAA